VPGGETQRNHMRSSIQPKQRVAQDHPPRPIRAMVDRGLKALSPRWALPSSHTGRTTRHPGYAISQRYSKLVKESLGGRKTVGPLRKLRHRGTALVNRALLRRTTADCLIRMRNLPEATARPKARRAPPGPA
jgi:hypothetical protein